MWICVRSIDREIELVGTEDTKEEICKVMLDDIYGYFTEAEFTDDIAHDDAEYNDSDLFAWSNAHNINYDWKCFWI